MRAPTIFGIVLIVVGVAALLFQGIEYTTDETVIDAGPIEVEAERERTIPIAPIVGVIAVVGGIVLIGVGKKA